MVLCAVRYASMSLWEVAPSLLLPLLPLPELAVDEGCAAFELEVVFTTVVFGASGALVVCGVLVACEVV